VQVPNTNSSQQYPLKVAQIALLNKLTSDTALKVLTVGESSLTGGNNSLTDGCNSLTDG
jgi:hypothetical protein